jgi:RHS repeat-associated protein
LKVGYDGNADDDIDDAGDDLVVTSPFGSTAITPSHDDNGNLTDDGTYKYTYDAWNRLVKATLNDTDITIQEAEFDGLGRRIRKTVTNSGDLDGTTVYLYNRHQIIETRNGSDEVMLQVYPGTRYIDEIVGLRVKDQGRLYAHQDANWNVTALTDLTGRVIEQYWYSPYGLLEAHVAAHPFDFDDDGDVDAQDIAAGTSGGTCWGDYDGASGDCKRLDADGDRDIDVDDYTIVSNYVATLDSDTKLQRIPAASHSRRGNLFAHQGLPLDAELASYQNRARQYAPAARRFMQKDQYCFKTRAGKGYHNGMNLHTYLGSNPESRKDFSGNGYTGFDWVCWCGPICNLTANADGGYASGVTDCLFGQVQGSGGANAVLHCMASCESGDNACSRCYWDGRESGGTAIDQMDLANNEFGRRLSGSLGGVSCAQACVEALNDGELTCVGTSGTFETCDPDYGAESTVSECEQAAQ